MHLEIWKVILTTLAAYTILASPAVIEAFVIDPWFWKRGKDDKPYSTYIRGAMMIVVALIVDFGMDYGKWYLALFASVMIHVWAFAWMINKELGVDDPLEHLGDGPYDSFLKKFPFWVRELVITLLTATSFFLLEFV